MRYINVLTYLTVTVVAEDTHSGLQQRSVQRIKMLFDGEKWNSRSVVDRMKKIVKKRIFESSPDEGIIQFPYYYTGL